jgi:hypothetical protein
MGGQFTTNEKRLVTIFLPEFNLRKRISWTFHVDDHSKSSITYDMIIGRDLLTELGMILNFQDKTVSWDTDTIPMREKGNLKTLTAHRGLFYSKSQN